MEMHAAVTEGRKNTGPRGISALWSIRSHLTFGLPLSFFVSSEHSHKLWETISVIIYCFFELLLFTDLYLHNKGGKTLPLWLSWTHILPDLIAGNWSEKNRVWSTMWEDIRFWVIEISLAHTKKRKQFSTFIWTFLQTLHFKISLLQFSGFSKVTCSSFLHFTKTWETCIKSFLVFQEQERDCYFLCFHSWGQYDGVIPAL